ncbi:MAG TPA: hypothetical protein VNA21_07090 [Steroidobacteraceae bacterium]|nr:hypothetical protein [Steroidobacteraceae bacterium]
MISDNDLLLYHYSDGLDANDHERVHLAVTTQPQLAARLRALVAELDRASATPDVVVPADVQRRWLEALAHAAADERAAARSHGYVPVSQLRWSLAALACVGLAILIGFKFGFQSSGVQSLGSPAQVTAPGVPQPSKEHGLQWHLASTERRLAELDNATEEERAQLIKTVIDQNRLHALAAERAGDVRLARALRSFTPILAGLAQTGADRSSSGDLAQLNFELRVMQARLSAESPAGRPARSVDL